MTDTHTVTIPIEITRWEPEAYDTPDEGPPLTQVVVEKRFQGPLEGTGRARLLGAQGEAGAGYVASERIEGVLEGRSGTFVVQHGAVAVGEEARPFGHVVPGSGTGELAGIEGTAVFTDDEAGPQLALTYSL